jgi:ATP-dependent DNA helicase RecQ
MFHGRERLELERLAQVVTLAESSGCITRRLLAYFGEKMTGKCGHCSGCAGAKRKKLPATPVPEVSLEDMEIVRRLRQERQAALQSPRQMARFLCGLQSPAIFRDRLSRHDAFGLLKAVPFDDVLALCSR